MFTDMIKNVHKYDSKMFTIMIQKCSQIWFKNVHKYD